MADPFGGSDDRGAPGKRPAQTIEGKATEIIVEPNEPEKEEAPRQAPEPILDERSAPESKDPAGAAEADRSAEKQAAPRTGPVELKGFMTHLAAGMLGAVIGVIGLALAWGLIPAREDADVAAVEERLASLEAKQQTAVPAEAVADLEKRLTAQMGQQQLEIPSEVAALPERVGQIEERFQALAKSAEAGGSVADAAAIATQIGEAEQRIAGKIDETLAEKLQSLRDEVGAQKQQLDQLAAAPAADAPDSPEIAALTERLAKLEQALPGLTESVASSARSAKAGAAALAFADLTRAVRSGQPFAAELAALKAVAPDLPAATPLAASADQGVATLETLHSTFEAAREQSETPPAPKDESLIGSVLASARSAVRIRRMDAADNATGPEAAIARAERNLADGDVAAAVAQIKSLPTPMQNAFTPWLEQAKERLAAEKAVAALEGEILPPLGAATEATPPRP
jgi:hypothetical protein